LDSTPKSQELERARQLISNGLCFSLEAVSQVAGLAGSQALWNRPQPLLAPLEHLPAWTPARLHKEMLPLLQPEHSFTLIARPMEAS
ncbi:MAG: insulinase family protein, partial [Prochlorococcus sp.]